MSGQNSSDGTKTRVRAGCKINIFLRITSRRQDKYHELDTLFLPLAEPHDELIISTMQEPGLRIRCAAPGIDLAHNTLTRSYDLFSAATGWRPNLDVELIKGIPHGAGLGGGSSDAASLLKYLQARCPFPVGDDALQQIALKVGADVPFFIKNIPRRAQGVGEKFSGCPVEWNILRELFLVLVCPPMRVSTAWAFAQWDKAEEARLGQVRHRSKKNSKFSPDFGRESLTDGDKPAKNHRSRLSKLFSVDAMPLLVAENSFEPIVFARIADMGQIKACLFREGAAAACMSGSGAALFGLFRQEAAARSAVDVLQKQGLPTYGPCLALT